jgi:hypothetical protein
MQGQHPQTLYLTMNTGPWRTRSRPAAALRARGARRRAPSGLSDQNPKPRPQPCVRAPGVGLLQHGALKAHDVALPAEAARQGLPLQPAEARPSNRHAAAPDLRLQVQRQRRLLDLRMHSPILSYLVSGGMWNLDSAGEQPEVLQNYSSLSAQWCTHTTPLCRLFEGGCSGRVSDSLPMQANVCHRFPDTGCKGSGFTLATT